MRMRAEPGGRKAAWRRSRGCKSLGWEDTGKRGTPGPESKWEGGGAEAPPPAFPNAPRPTRILSASLGS